jgi:hypothetical protein
MNVIVIPIQSKGAQIERDMLVCSGTGCIVGVGPVWTTETEPSFVVSVTKLIKAAAGAGYGGAGIVI